MKFADFAVWSEARFSGMVKTALMLAVTTTLKELRRENRTDGEWTKGTGAVL
ncbi:hypothetical protein ACLK1Z_16790 [Escherichia coli]